MTEKVFIVLHETLTQSLIKDVTTVAMVMTVGITGYVIRSRFLEIFGGIMILIFMLMKLNGAAKVMTPEQAIQFIQSTREKPE